MTQVKEIHEILLITGEEYAKDYTDRYIRWCYDKAINETNDLQKIVSNSSINKWYNHEFDRLEQSFMEIATAQTGKISYKEMREIYAEIVVQIFPKYPNPLLESARKLNIYAN